MTYKRYALISIYNKNEIKDICKVLKKYKIGIIATGSTSKRIKSLGYQCQNIRYFTKFKEILDGRVKTLHHKIYASILHDREKKSHFETIKKLNFPNIDFVIVNLYPFEKEIIKNNDLEQCIEMIDIGGVTLLRSAAKNFKYVTTISSISDYSLFIKNLIANNGQTSLYFRKKMSKKVFKLTSNYDNIILRSFDNNKNKRIKSVNLKYGENPYQKSKFIFKQNEKSFFDTKIQGKEIGYNNILDLDSGLSCINEFYEPTCVIVKHNNPCGVASSSLINDSFKKAYNSDPKSAFGGIVILNRTVDSKLASLLSKNFFEIVAAKNFTKKSLGILSLKKKLILIKTKDLLLNKNEEIKNVIGGNLIQKRNFKTISKKNITCVSIKKAKEKEIKDLIFAFKVCKHVKSNAVVLVKNKKTIGIGAGQMSRIDATKLALNKIIDKNEKNNFVAASDGFFPFTDSAKELEKKRCIAIIQPQGSINDIKMIEFSNLKRFALYFSKNRFFKH